MSRIFAGFMAPARCITAGMCNVLLIGIEPPCVVEQRDSLVGIGHHPRTEEVTIERLENQCLLYPVLFDMPSVREYVQSHCLVPKGPLWYEAFENSGRWGSFSLACQVPV